MVFETGSHYVTQAGFKLPILPPQPPECWDYKQHLARFTFKVEKVYHGSGIPRNPKYLSLFKQTYPSLADSQPKWLF
jgi:hypothetical protein